MTEHAKGLSISALLVAMVSVQVGVTFAKRIFPLVGAQGATGLRLAFASLILLIVIRPWQGRISKTSMTSIVLYGAALGGMNLAFYLAVERIPLGITVAIEFLGPLAVALFNSRRTLDFIWAALAAAGLSILLPIGENAGSLDPVGLGFALAAAACWGLYILAGHRLGKSMGSGRGVALGMIVATALVLPFSVMSAKGDMFNPVVVGNALLVALLSSALPYTLEMVALKSLPLKTFGILMSLEPAIAALSGALLLGESLTGLQWLAIICVMAASAGTSLSGGSDGHGS